MGLFDKLLGSKENIHVSKDEINEFIKACELGQIQDVDRILKSNRNVVNSQSERGSTGLMSAAHKRHKNVVELLIKSGADLNIQWEDKLLAKYKKARETGSMGKFLLTGEDVGERRREMKRRGIEPPDDYTALIFAASAGHKDIVELLIKSGANLNVKSFHNITALMLAANKGHKDVVELLVKGGADLNIQNIFNETALILAAREGKTKVVELLVKGGADLNIQDTHGNTALMFAAAKDYLDIGKILISNFADLNIKNKNGDNVEKIAETRYLQWSDFKNL